MNLHRNSIIALTLAAVLPLIVLSATPRVSSSCDHDKATSATAAVPATDAVPATAQSPTTCSAGSASACMTSAKAVSACMASAKSASVIGCCSARSATRATVASSGKARKVTHIKVAPGAPGRRLIQTSIASAPGAARRRASIGSAGLKVAIDPVTGQLTRPTPEQMQALSGSGSALGVSSSQKAAPEIVYNSDGSAMMRLGDAYASTAKVRMGADGKWVFDCNGSPTVTPAATVASAPAPARHEVAEK